MKARSVLIEPRLLFWTSILSGPIFKYPMRPDPVRTREHTDGGFTEGKKENGGDWMASPSSSPSYLNSTCRLLACLDLKEKHAEVDHLFCLSIAFLGLFCERFLLCRFLFLLTLTYVLKIIYNVFDSLFRLPERLFLQLFWLRLSSMFCRISWFLRSD